MNEKILECKKCGSQITKGKYCKRCDVERKEKFKKGAEVVGTIVVGSFLLKLLTKTNEEN